MWVGAIWRFTVIGFTVVMVSGCLDGPDGLGEPASGEQGPSHERQVKHVTESGMITEMGHAHSLTFRAGQWDFEVNRPEHFSEAWFVLDWQAQSDAYFEEIEMQIRKSESSDPAWKSVSGSGTLNMSVDKGVWAVPSASVSLDPYSSTYPMSAYVEVEWSVEVTLVQQIPVEEEQEADAGKGRGSNDPRG